jgi:hypothetical protein
MRPQGFGQSVPGLEDLGWNDMGFEPPKPAAVPAPDADHDAFGEEIDEHSRVHPTGLSPVHSPVHTQQAEIAERLAGDETDSEVDGTEDEVDETAEIYEPEAELEAAPEPPSVLDQLSASAKSVPVPSPAPSPRSAPSSRPVSTPRSAPGSKAKAAFTLRLDPQRHLKLRLACAVGGRSAQQIVTDALDQLLGAMPELEAMAAKAKRKG